MQSTDAEKQACLRSACSANMPAMETQQQMSRKTERVYQTADTARPGRAGQLLQP